MQYIVSAGTCWETIDMGIRSHGMKMTPVREENLREGMNLLEELSEKRKAIVRSFRDGVLEFEFMGKMTTLQPGHIWHSPMLGEYNPAVEESVGYLVSVRPQRDPSLEEASADRALALLDAMRKNAAEEGSPVWKNIPLAREFFDILHNRLPLSGQYIDASGIVVLCDSIFLEDLLDRRDVPRLCLEFLQLRKMAVKAQRADDDKFDPSFVLGVLEAGRIQNRLDFYIDPEVTMEWWVDYTRPHLLFDPVERTPQWEEIAYEVEKKCDRLLAGEPRGMGFCFSYWSVKKAVLAGYGIDWKTPSQMNPRVMFD